MLHLDGQVNIFYFILFFIYFLFIFIYLFFYLFLFFNFYLFFIFYLQGMIGAIAGISSAGVSAHEANLEESKETFR